MSRLHTHATPEADAAAAPPAPLRGDARAGARDAAVARHVHAAAVRLRGRGRPARGAVDARRVQPVGRRSGQGGDGGAGPTASASVLLFGLPEHKDDVGSAAYDPEAPVQSAVRAIKREVPDVLVVTDVCLCEYTDHGHCGIVDRRRDRERSDGRSAGARRGVARRRRRRHRRAVGHDGRPRRRDPAGARRARLRERRDHVVRGEVLLGVLRAVPRGRRVGAEVRRPPIAPDGSGQRRGGAARGRAGHRRRRRHRDGEAGAALSRRHRAREGRVRLSDRGVPRERRVRDAEGGGAQRLDRRARARCWKR